MTEDEYLAIVYRIQQAMAIEPFVPNMGDVIQLLDDWRAHEVRLRDLRMAWAAVKESWGQGDSEQAVAYMELDTLLGVDADGNVPGMLPANSPAWREMVKSAQVRLLTQSNAELRAEIERLLIDNAELSDECDQWERKQEQSWQEIADLRDELARAKDA